MLWVPFWHLLDDFKVGVLPPNASLVQKVNVSVPCMPFDAASISLYYLKPRERLILACQKVYKASEDLRCRTNPLYNWLLLVLSEIHSFKNVP